MEIQIRVKIVNPADETGPDKPTMEDVVEFIKTLQNLDGVTVEVE